MFVVAASGGADDVGVCKQIVAAKLLEPLARPDQQPHEAHLRVPTGPLVRRLVRGQRPDPLQGFGLVHDKEESPRLDELLRREQPRVGRANHPGEQQRRHRRGQHLTAYSHLRGERVFPRPRGGVQAAEDPALLPGVAGESRQPLQHRSRAAATRSADLRRHRQPVADNTVDCLEGFLDAETLHSGAGRPFAPRRSRTSRVVRRSRHDPPHTVRQRVRRQRSALELGCAAARLHGYGPRSASTEKVVGIGIVPDLSPSNSRTAASS